MPTIQKSKRDLVSGIFNQLFYLASTSSFQRSYPSKLEVTAAAAAAAAAAAKSLQLCPTLQAHRRGSRGSEKQEGLPSKALSH